MAKSIEIKIPDDIEYRVIGNAFGLLIASAGLVSGEMLRFRSFDFWRDDIVPLALLLWMGFRLYRNLLSTMNAYQYAAVNDHDPIAGMVPIHGERVVAGHITAKPGYSADQVIEEVAKRIESKKEEAMKKNKFTN